MQLVLDHAELQPLIEAVVRHAVAQLDRDRETLGEKLAFSEVEAAALLSMETHQLRDERRRGRIEASQIVNRGIRYLRGDLIAYLMQHRVTGEASR